MDKGSFSLLIPHFVLHRWCDSDWAAFPLTKRYITGWIVHIGSSPITWKTKKQDTVLCTSAEAEYIVTNEVTRQLKLIKALLHDIGHNHIEPMAV